MVTERNYDWSPRSSDQISSSPHLAVSCQPDPIAAHQSNPSKGSKQLPVRSDLDHIFSVFYNKKVSRPFSKFAFSTYLIQKIEAWTSFTSSGSIGWGISNYQLLKLPIWPRSSLPAFWPDAPDNIERHGHCLNAMMVNGRVFEVWWCGVTFVAYKPTNRAWFSKILMQ